MFTGVYIIFLISAQKHTLGYSLEMSCRGGSNEYPQSMFRAEIYKKNYQNFYLKKIHLFGGKIFTGGGGGGREGRGWGMGVGGNFLYMT